MTKPMTLSSVMYLVELQHDLAGPFAQTLREAIKAYAAEQVAEALKKRNEPRSVSKGESEAIDRALACLNGGARSVTVLYTDDMTPAEQEELKCKARD